MLVHEELVNLIDDDPHPFEQFAAMRRGGATLKILRQHVKLFRETLETVHSHKRRRLS